MNKTKENVTIQVIQAKNLLFSPILLNILIIYYTCLYKNKTRIPCIFLNKKIISIILFYCTFHALFIMLNSKTFGCVLAYNRKKLLAIE